MYCPKCGKPTDARVRFCPSCGVQIAAGFVPAGASYAAGAYPQGKLMRPRYPRMIGGVCSAFALQYGWDVTLVRVLTAVAACLTGGTVALAYLVAWVIIPEATYALPSGVPEYPPQSNASFSPGFGAGSTPPPPPPAGSTTA